MGRDLVYGWKAPLAVRIGQHALVKVHPSQRRELRLSWGQVDESSFASLPTSIAFHACSEIVGSTDATGGNATETAWPGSFVTRRRSGICARLLVTTSVADKPTPVTVPVRKNCPGTTSLLNR
jgi:hypothetical protein